MPEAIWHLGCFCILYPASKKGNINEKFKEFIIEVLCWLEKLLEGLEVGGGVL